MKRWRVETKIKLEAPWHQDMSHNPLTRSRSYSDVALIYMFFVELPGIEPASLPGLLPSDLPVRYVSFPFSPARYLRFRYGS